MDEFKITLSERRLMKKLRFIAQRLQERRDLLKAALGDSDFDDVDTSGAFGEEMDALCEALLIGLGLPPLEWNIELSYEYLCGDIDEKVFVKFAAETEEESQRYGYNSRDGYYVISENPDHAKFEKFFFGGNSDE